jgi:hypothetical protein
LTTNRPVLNSNAPIAEVRKDASGKLVAYLVQPWNSFFQQHTQQAPAVVSITTSPYTPNSSGTVIITGAATITLTRGLVNISLTGLNPAVIPMAIGDTISWTGGATVKFLGA